MSQNVRKVGFYCWAGPGTIRMTQLKYFNPAIDSASMISSYDDLYLQRIKELFGVTDVWVSYSWGFADETEKIDKDFTLSKLVNFKKNGMKTHAYVQGPNVVYEDFKDKKDWFAKDLKGKLVSYHRGRKVVCLNNPEYKKYVSERITEMCSHDFDGIFMDNIQMGQLGVPGTFPNKSIFFGCNCMVCNELFLKKTGQSIAIAFKSKAGREKYLQFRLKSTLSFIKVVSDIVHKQGKEFGTNSYDPKFNTQHVYGTDVKKLEKYQDYILFENHSLPNRKRTRHNQYIQRFIETYKLSKPVFVVSYKKGIGFDSSYTQQELDLVFSEAEHSNFAVCLKGSEFVTKKIWHNLMPEKYRKPSIIQHDWITRRRNILHRIKVLIQFKLLSPITPYHLTKNFFELYMERKLARKALGWLQVMILK